MTPRLRVLSARDVLQALASFGFEVASTRGSHAKLRRKNEAGELEILTIPLHRELAPGTLLLSEANQWPEEVRSYLGAS